MNHRSTLFVHTVLLVLMLALSAWAVYGLPADVRGPVHWDYRLKPDRWAGKAGFLLLAPALSLLLGLFFAVSPRVDPRMDNLEKSAASYHVCWLAAASLCAMLHVGFVGRAAGWSLRMEALLPMALALMLMTVGNVLGKVRSNHLIGVRTPWTLASDEVWTRSNRATGRLLVITGLLGFIAAIAGKQTLALGALTVGALGSAVFGFLYSYLAWRRLLRAETP